MDISKLSKRHERGMNGITEMSGMWNDIGDYIRPRKPYLQGADTSRSPETVDLF